MVCSPACLCLICISLCVKAQRRALRFLLFFVPAVAEPQRPLFPDTAASFRQRRAVLQRLPEREQARCAAAEQQRRQTGTGGRSREYAPAAADSSDGTERENVKVGQILSLESEKDHLIKDKYAPGANA